MDLIYVPFRSLRSDTWEALKDVAEFVPLKWDDDYARFFRNMWTKGETFVSIEHDCVPTLEQIKELFACPKGWCGLAYYESPYDVPPLACVKFGTDFMKGHPEAWRSLPLWTHCDQHIFAEASDTTFHCHGNVVHVQRGSVLTDKVA